MSVQLERHDLIHIQNLQRVTFSTGSIFIFYFALISNQQQYEMLNVYLIAIQIIITRYMTFVPKRAALFLTEH